MHTLRHIAAMRLLLAGNDITVIALWLGHEQIATTNIYLHADMTHRQQAIDRTKPLSTKPGRYLHNDALLTFLGPSDCADTRRRATPPDEPQRGEVGTTRTSHNRGYAASA